MHRTAEREWRVMALRAALTVIALCSLASGSTVFLEAEGFQCTSGGWRPESNHETRGASRTRTLWGWDGPGDAVATRTITLAEAGRHRLWVRYLQQDHLRGPFCVAVSAEGKELATGTFDLDPSSGEHGYLWKSFDAQLPRGPVTLAISKHQNKNCSRYTRHVDCILLTTDLDKKPDHAPFGPQTFVRVTIGKTVERPVFVRIFADHFRDPWYRHLCIGREGLRDGLYSLPAKEALRPGEQSPWCNISATVYQDSGARLDFTLQHAATEKARRLDAKIEFARAGGWPEAKPLDSSPVGQPVPAVEAVKTFEVDAQPNGLVIIAPPDLDSPSNIALLRRDRDYAEETGRIADAFDWPAYGHRPAKFPFLVCANIGGYELAVDAAVTARERKTLDYFAFTGTYRERELGGLWHMQGGSYARPDLDKMRRLAQTHAEAFRKSGRRLDEIVCFNLMDEPQGQAASFMAQDPGYVEKFRAWIRAKGIGPADLLVENWEQVRPVPETDRARFPALHYHTQLFRTRALGDFMSTQRKILEQAYGVRRSIPAVVNFSDGAVYSANFCGQGIDYFELLDVDDQNAIWGEDWANISSTYQMGSYNVALMQAAARPRGQTIGHYLIAYAGRTAWDTKTKAISETARGVRIWASFFYGPNWGSHHGGPPWNCDVWGARPELWRANAEITREIGAVEDWLLAAKPAVAETALVYSSASDIWTMGQNLAFGFDRMHTWLALAHAQVPVDIVPEREIERRGLAHKACYLSGPNLTRAAAAKLKAWVEAGGTLWLTAGAATRDEYNRPMNLLADILPAQREDLVTFAAHHGPGRSLGGRAAKETVNWGGEAMEVLSVRQPLKPAKGAEVLATFADGSPAVVSGAAGRGRIICCGFLPALSYVKPALDARQRLEKIQAQSAAAVRAAGEKGVPEATSSAASAASKGVAVEGVSRENREMLERSYNPWQFPDGIRQRLLLPVRASGVAPPLACDTPLVDAVLLPCEQGWLVALSNFSSKPIAELRLSIRDAAGMGEAVSVRRGPLGAVRENGMLKLVLPLDETDFIRVSKK